LLREGLRRLGIRGSGLETKSHDEMDAATSAIVGRYFESGLYEPMGITSEAQLIVPKVAPLCFDPRPVVCLSGKTGVGKSVVARYLSVFYGFRWIPTRQIVKQLLEKDLCLPKSQRLYQGGSDLSKLTEQDLRTFGLCLLDEHKQIPVQAELTRTIAESVLPVVVDSVRNLEDVNTASLADRPVLIWFVDCNDAIIMHRLISRSKLGVDRLKSPSPVDHTAPSLRRAAHRILNNNGTLEELRWRVDDTLFSDMTLRA
jgi:dephospho-CoA kinase